ncbi:phenylacetate-CoA oxygenase subunit PaaC [Pendulispora rubella]|uniref:Phenylacetate-CoA oxygenase subunit PaaC n=1 Tax=Pendulispora rubella TaxID=2741070 RepID=A0ABZ2L6V3_9BACT
MGSVTLLPTPLFRYTLRRADDALILGHRLSQSCGHAPTMEEDMALANIGLDLIDQARWLYAYAGQVEAAGRDEDAYAYLRNAGGYGNLLLVEQPHRDFARTIVRQFFYSAFIHPYWRALTQSSDATLAAIAAKARNQSTYHVSHSAAWVIRLGNGTEENHRHVSTAIDELWPFTDEMFEVDTIEQRLIERAVVVDPASLRPRWEETIGRVFARATLDIPSKRPMRRGGRHGHHGEHLARLLGELRHMQRAFRGAFQ